MVGYVEMAIKTLPQISGRVLHCDESMQVQINCETYDTHLSRLSHSHITICERPQKRDDVVDLAIVEARLVAR